MLTKPNTLNIKIPLTSYLSAWTEPDKKNREKSINQTLSRAIIFVSPETSTNKRNGVLKEIEKFQSDFKNAKLNYAPAKFSGRNAHLSWNLEGASGDNISSGYSSLTFDKKGRIVKVAVFY